MNARQKAGIGGLISGVITMAISVFVLSGPETPLWVDQGVKILAILFEAIGLVVNLPSNTNPK